MQAQRLTSEQIRRGLELASTKARQGDPAGALQVRARPSKAFLAEVVSTAGNDMAAYNEISVHDKSICAFFFSKVKER